MVYASGKNLKQARQRMRGKNRRAFYKGRIAVSTTRYSHTNSQGRWYKARLKRKR